MDRKGDCRQKDRVRKGLNRRSNSQTRTNRTKPTRSVQRTASQAIDLSHMEPAKTNFYRLYVIQQVHNYSARL